MPVLALALTRLLAPAQLGSLSGIAAAGEQVHVPFSPSLLSLTHAAKARLVSVFWGGADGGKGVQSQMQLSTGPLLFAFWRL